MGVTGMVFDGVSDLCSRQTAAIRNSPVRRRANSPRSSIISAQFAEYGYYGVEDQPLIHSTGQTSVGERRSMQYATCGEKMP